MLFKVSPSVYKDKPTWNTYRQVQTPEALGLKDPSLVTLGLL